MTKKRLQNKVKKQEQEIHRLTTIIKKVSRVSKIMALKYGNYTDEVARYGFMKISETLIDRLYENTEKKEGVKSG